MKPKKFDYYISYFCRADSAAYPHDCHADSQCLCLISSLKKTRCIDRNTPGVIQNCSSDTIYHIQVQTNGLQLS